MGTGGVGWSNSLSKQRERAKAARQTPAWCGHGAEDPGDWPGVVMKPRTQVIGAERTGGGGAQRGLGPWCDSGRALAFTPNGKGATVPMESHLKQCINCGRKKGMGFVALGHMAIGRFLAEG